MAGFRYLPVMISRIMLSLKEAADFEQEDWSLGGLSTNGNDLQSIKFFRPRVGASSGEDGIPLDTYLESHVVIR